MTPEEEMEAGRLHGETVRKLEVAEKALLYIFTELAVVAARSEKSEFYELHCALVNAASQGLGLGPNHPRLS